MTSCDSLDNFSVNSFEDLDLSQNILRGIYELGYVTPSPVQKKCILPMIKKRDVLGQAQSGTGKTATFSISVLQLLSKQKGVGIILEPTRELVEQTADVVSQLGKHCEKIKIVACTANQNFHENKKCIESIQSDQSMVLVATPGRACNLMKKIRWLGMPLPFLFSTRLTIFWILHAASIPLRKILEW